ncbi:WYL domain-containing protein [Weeksellaceae bacterium KMM 9713]|uniref:WYL domain-containing protein n=1 Tax=Profundicola chukchiensis TaxID=2961959 RepID=A0A9X4MVR6_9FLAO|nr:WYL domain-containing protein [Profundicola chukchiensis]MDG4945758.1 WYL domain-containing protein [Profundicola chukchiensis]
MAINKNALIRYQALDRCFRNTGRLYFIDDLLEECNKALMELDPSNAGIQRRQLFDDIKFMESEQGWSIDLDRVRHGRKVYYRYVDPKFSINNQPLNDAEAEQIMSALQIFSRFSGAPQFEWVNEMIPMLESKFGLIKRDKEVMSFESNLDLKGLEFLSPLFNAIVNKRVVEVTYQDFKSEEPYPIEFHPYYLKQYNARWFVFGYCEVNVNYYWNLALDRIHKVQELDLEYKENNEDWDDYFSDIVGVTRPLDEDVQEIMLVFNTRLAPYILTKPLHQSQKFKWVEDGLEVRIKVIPNYELEKLVLSFGEDVLVVSPSTFRQKIENRIKSMADRY